MIKQTLISIISVGILSSITGCGLLQPNSPSNNNTGKEVVATMQLANSVLYATCSSLATQTKNAKLASDCNYAYKSTADKLVDVQTALDNNSATFVCAVALAESALEDFDKVYTSTGHTLPVAVVTAEAIGRAIGVSCSAAPSQSPQKLGIKVP